MAEQEIALGSVVSGTKQYVGLSADEYTKYVGTSLIYYPQSSDDFTVTSAQPSFADGTFTAYLFGGSTLNLGNVTGPFGETANAMKWAGTTTTSRCYIRHPRQYIDNTKTYRVSFWLRKNANGTVINRVYFQNIGSDGTSTSNLVKTSTKVAETSYFLRNYTSDNADTYIDGNWQLMVGYIHPYGYVPTTNDSALYATNGTKNFTLVDWQWDSQHTEYYFNPILPYNGEAEYYVLYPRFDLVDGNEPTITELLAAPISQTTLTTNGLAYKT